MSNLRDTVLDEFRKWLRSERAALFTIRGQAGKAIGQRLNDLELPDTLREAEIIVGRALFIVPEAVDARTSWAKDLRKQLKSWESSLKAARENVSSLDLAGSVADGRLSLHEALEGQV